MSSINTNLSAITALQSLRSTQQSLSNVQKQLSTGLKVSSAADNASTYATATKMKSDQGVLSTISDSLAVGSSMLGVSIAAVKNEIDVMNKIKNTLVQAQDPNADLSKINAGLAALGPQLTSFAQAAGFNGVNLLDGNTTTNPNFQSSIKLIASYVDGGNNQAVIASTVNTISITATAVVDGAGGGIVDGGTTNATNFTTLAGVTAANAGGYLQDADEAIAKLTDYAAKLGSAQGQVDAQKNFIQGLNDALTAGVSSLVDADLNEVSTRLQALQTQQQLGVQALSIANQNSQVILRLFQ